MKKSNTDNLQAILDEKKRIEDGGKFHWSHGLILFLSLALTLVAWYFAKTQNDIKIESQFKRESAQTIELVSERMQKYEDILTSAAAFLESQEKYTDIQQWSQYSRSLDIENKYPGINGIGVIHNIQPESVELYEAYMRRDRPDFSVYPKHKQTELFPIAYIEPVAINAAAVGLDIAHESTRYAAAKKARETGKPQITGPITLVQDAQQTPGFLFFVPFYKVPTPETVNARNKEFAAMTYAPFIFNKLMQGTLDGERRQVSLTIYDGEHILFDENQPDNVDYDPNALFASSQTIDMYGRQWNFELRSTNSFRVANHNNRPGIILWGGLIINALLLGIFALLARANRRAAIFASSLAHAHEDKAARLSDVIDNAVEGFMTVTDDGKIETFNKACADIFKTPPDEATGQPLVNFIPDILLPTVSSSNTATDIIGQRKNGQTFPAELSANTLIIHGRKVYSIIIRDISKRKEDEAVIQRTLEDLEQSNADLEKFAYIASHDLKSPLRAIDNLSLWITEDLGPQVDEENKERLGMLRGRVNRMENLLSDLLNYSRATDDIHSNETLTLAALIDNVEDILDVPEGFEIIAPNTAEDIVITRLPLQNILHNILCNAIKHHDKETGRIQIEAEDKGTAFEFSISDDGPGIPPEYHEKIFVIFQTLKPRDEVEGSGMGLAIAKKLVTRHRGTIRVESELGKGSRFIFTWPKNDFSSIETAA